MQKRHDGSLNTIMPFIYLCDKRNIIMRWTIQAACGCNTGKVRKNNEDNFFFDSKCLEMYNNGLESNFYFEKPLRSGLCISVFDGMGGENFGEVASFSAAHQMQIHKKKFTDFFIPANKYLTQLTNRLNKAVVKAQMEMCTDRMGTTMVSLYYANNRIYIYNVGDSRAYHLRKGVLSQKSVDHVEKRPGKEIKKAPLTQYLGFGTDEFLLEPHITEVEPKKDDIYLLCSDGLTDMLTDKEIADILLENNEVSVCAKKLMQSALDHGGRDNITVIVCKIR